MVLLAVLLVVLRAVPQAVLPVLQAAVDLREVVGLRGRGSLQVVHSREEDCLVVGGLQGREVLPVVVGVVEEPLRGLRLLSLRGRMVFEKDERQCPVRAVRCCLVLCLTGLAWGRAVTM